jgi:predicted CopG family antitoxin
MNIKPKIYTKLVNFKISPDEYEILKLISEEEKKPASEIFREFIKEKQREIEWVKMEINSNQLKMF